jgi:hypothetical protein
MTGRKWTTNAQEAWLRKELPMFLQVDSTQMRKRFFDDICIAWQGKWPDTEPTAEELAKVGGDLTEAVATKRQKKDKVSTKKFFGNAMTYSNSCSKSRRGLITINVLRCREKETRALTVSVPCLTWLSRALGTHGRRTQTWCTRS